ncbi:ribonuclease HI [Prosthecobacter fusiformis]|uniref:Ribonuclease H n=1 Tax=Prosthecobacter fusiformis TaxID=48464 RepID=A0A4R7SSA9_9BACT|nr:ribonuclease HI [Prosthecobacter fusiformis]TDU81625.1 ribonuclease HI [Prosthecobacter fusiformis]
MTSVTIYTDGACSGNPGPGGYGVLLQAGQHTKELSEGYRKTTNNRMELMALIKGLELLNRPCVVTLFSDSKYVVDTVEKGWAKAWKSRGWIKADKQPAVNADLWDRALKALEKHRVTIRWVKGHASNAGNNRCDELAVAATRSPGLLVDEGYERAKAKPASLL